MTQLTDLIAAYKRWREDRFAAHSKRDKAAVELSNYVLHCEQFWTELHRVGHEMTNVDRQMRITPLGEEHTDLSMQLDKLKIEFGALLDKEEAREAEWKRESK